MKNLALLTVLMLITTIAGCDMRSGIAKKEMEKFDKTPLPAVSPTPTEVPIDPADSVTADLEQTGNTINLNEDSAKKTIDCTKLNNVMVNGSSNEITIKGVCRQLMINGDNNQINANAAIEYVLNGTNNNITYAKFVNAKRPSITENKDGNIIEHAKKDAPPAK